LDIGYLIRLTWGLTGIEFSATVSG